MLYLTPLLTTLAYLNGERSVNSTTSAPRTDFLQKTLEEAYQAYPWRFAQATATLTLSSGIATLPTNFDIDHRMYASYYPSVTSEVALEEVDLADKGSANDGDNKFWINHITDNVYTAQTKDSISTGQVVIVYQTTAPTLSASVGTPYSSANTLALGARRFVKLGQNPDADISQDQALFEKQLSSDIAAAQVPGPRKKRGSTQKRSGTFTGDW